MGDQGCLCRGGHCQGPLTTPQYNSMVWWPAWLRGAQHGPQRVCLIQEGLISGAGGGGGLPYWGNKQHTVQQPYPLHNAWSCSIVVCQSGLHYAPHCSPKFAPNRQKCPNSTRQRNVVCKLWFNFVLTHFRYMTINLKSFVHCLTLRLHCETDRPHGVADSLR